ncbi:hypothetical protein C1T17_16855 [Sphingobium sp. SCG-1]|uniref:DUF2141 domain-containing protein n=1 Tax=Sphingobium sp. SCG-1 TaxID=2072936 RepID=UPI000CD69683|nr:DUF2141 domain-containing protein [Sphingobium sp. SCG-1]AUW59497.1 hypothetical protein C1T17_16855 [Sphingobium sp. SCG-1]
MKNIRKIAALAALWTAASAAAPVDLVQTLSVDVSALRSAKGNLIICVTRLPDHFPDCTGDPDRRHYTVNAAQTQAKGMTITDLPPGTYAIALIHDENGNHKLDTFAGIPREGVAFSRNPPIRFGAPTFNSARFSVAGAPVEQDLKMKYFL